jgi:hypothetical protein
MDLESPDVVLVCPGCHRNTAYLTGETPDSVACSDTESCLWLGTTAEAHFVESLV